MSTADIRHKLVEYIRFADDKKVKAIYVILENQINCLANDLESGKTKGITKEKFVKKAKNKILKG